MHFLPFFRVQSEELKKMLGVEDNRTVIAYLNELECHIYGEGKHKYVLSDELVEAIKKLDKQENNYIPAKKYW